MQNKKTVELIDYFKNPNRGKRLIFKTKIIEAKRELNHFEHYFSFEKMYAQIEKRKLPISIPWEESQVYIKNVENIIEEVDEIKQKSLLVVSNFSQELFWIFSVISKICYRYNLQYFTKKFQLYGCLAHRAIRYIEKHDEILIIKNKTSDVYLKSLFHEILDEFEIYLYHVEKELISVH